jgi:hypothetical protein
MSSRTACPRLYPGENIAPRWIIGHSSAVNANCVSLKGLAHLSTNSSFRQISSCWRSSCERGTSSDSVTLQNCFSSAASKPATRPFGYRSFVLHRWSVQLFVLSVVVRLVNPGILTVSRQQQWDCDDISGPKIRETVSGLSSLGYIPDEGALDCSKTTPPTELNWPKIGPAIRSPLWATSAEQRAANTRLKRRADRTGGVPPGSVRQRPVPQGGDQPRQLLLLDERVHGGRQGKTDTQHGAGCHPARDRATEA